MLFIIGFLKFIALFLFVIKKAFFRIKYIVSKDTELFSRNIHLIDLIDEEALLK